MKSNTGKTVSGLVFGGYTAAIGVQMIIRGEWLFAVIAGGLSLVSLAIGGYYASRG